MLLTGANVLTMVPGTGPEDLDLRIDGERIAELGSLAARPDEPVVDCRGLTMIPGFVQTHVHLCQTLFRNLAEGLPLLPWLERWIWPLEAAHDRESLTASARLGLYELATGGCTTFQSMEVLRGSEHVFDAILATPLRALSGPALVAGDDPRMPPDWRITAAEALEIRDRLFSSYHGRDGRLFLAESPRFVLSATADLLEGLAARAVEQGTRIHTHASEHPEEAAAVAARFGSTDVDELDRKGLLGPRTTLAHMVQADPERLRLAADRGCAVAHCPTANLKLGSGIANLREFLDTGLTVGLGSDGAACNNRLDPLTELRHAGLLAQLEGGPGAVDPETLLGVATREGARALGLDAVCGTIEAGKSADLVLLDLGTPECGPGGDPATRIVYCADRSRIRHVVCRGRFVVRDGRPDPALFDPQALVAEAKAALQGLLARARPPV